MRVHSIPLLTLSLSALPPIPISPLPSRYSLPPPSVFHLPPIHPPFHSPLPLIMGMKREGGETKGRGRENGMGGEEGEGAREANAGEGEGARERGGGRGTAGRSDNRDLSASIPLLFSSSPFNCPPPCPPIPFLSPLLSTKRGNRTFTPRGKSLLCLLVVLET